MWRSTLWMNLIDDESSTNYKLKRKKKREKKWKMWEVFKTQNAEGSKCFKCAAWSALFITKQAVIISKLFHHFAKVSSFFDAMRNLDDASSRWRELSIVASPSDLRTNEIFVTVFSLMNKIWTNLKNSFVCRSRFEHVFDASRCHNDSLSKRIRVENCDRWFLCSSSQMNQNYENCQTKWNAIQNASSFRREWWHLRHFFQFVSSSYSDNEKFRRQHTSNCWYTIFSSA